jgi:probable rRNA maturation factor
MAKPDPLTLDIIFEDPAWTDAGSDLEDRLRRAVETGIACVGVGGPVEISLLLTSDGHQRDLNARHRNVDRPTNVLSFPLDEAPAPGATRHLGDITLAFGTVAAEAVRDGKTLSDHAAHLVLHGLFHLLGYDHETDEDAAEMEALEVSALARLGIADPYRVTHNPGGGSRAAC